MNQPRVNHVKERPSKCIGCGAPAEDLSADSYDGHAALSCDRCGQFHVLPGSVALPPDLIRVEKRIGNVYVADPRFPDPRLWVQDSPGWEDRLAAKLRTICGARVPKSFKFEIPAE